MASLYEHIRAQRMPQPDDHAGGLAARVALPAPARERPPAQLPDEPGDDEAPFGGPTIRWAAGARDGVAVFHVTGRSPGLRQVAPIVDALLAWLRSPGNEEREMLEQVVVRVVGDAAFVSFVGPVLDRLEAELDDPANSIVAATLPASVRRLVVETSQRDVLKLAIALLGAFGGPEDRELLETVGLHDEFTFYAVDALAAIVPDPIESWMLLAVNLAGWGKIHAVLALVEALPDSGARAGEIRDFLLRYGCENGVQNGYLALPIAEATGLAEALAASDGRAPDAPLLLGAGLILSSLAEDAAQGGPTSDMGDYADGAVAAERFLHHITAPGAPGGDTLDAFLSVASLRAFLRDTVPSDAGRWEALGWTNERVWPLLEIADAWIQDEHWRTRALDLLKGDALERWKARAVCRVLEIPMAQELEIVVGADPSDVGAWFDLSVQADREGIERATVAARSLLRLERLFAPGPSNTLGFGPDFPRFEVCDALAKALARYPGSGGEFLRLLLQSPSVRNRHSALRAYENWPQLGPADREAVAVVAAGDPDGRVREHAEKIRLEKG